MKFITSLLLTALLAYALGTQLPWYSIAIAACIIAIAIPQKLGKTYLSGFLGIALIWTMLTIIANYTGAAVIASQMAKVFPLKGNVILLSFISIVIGGIIGGFGAITGHFSRKMFS